MNHSQWTAFYIGIGEKLASFSSRRPELYDKIKDFAANEPLLHYLHFDRPGFWEERGGIDPLTVFATFNRAVSTEHRIELAGKLASLLGLALEPPASFHGIAHLDPRNSIYSGDNEIWELFLAASAKNRDAKFGAAYDNVAKIRGNGQAMLTIGLFWIQPYAYMALDGLSLPYIKSRLGLEPPKKEMSGSEYTEFLEKLEPAMESAGIEGFPELAFQSWASAHSD